MRKIKRMVLHDAMRQLSSAQMQTLKGGAGDYVACVCSCNDAIGTWTTKCNVDSLGQDFLCLFNLWWQALRTMWRIVNFNMSGECQCLTLPNKNDKDEICICYINNLCFFPQNICTEHDGSCFISGYNTPSGTYHKKC